MIVKMAVTFRLGRHKKKTNVHISYFGGLLDFYVQYMYMLQWVFKVIEFIYDTFKLKMMFVLSKCGR